MHVRVAFKKKKVVHERVVWVVSVFDNPRDIVAHDTKTMTRLQQELFGKNSKADKHIVVREILSKKFISNSTISLDEHKSQNQIKV
tara:strand:- start:3748 stop:4005 length:258 start_codon:yes stop_codon:yes gene_type:complete